MNRIINRTETLEQNTQPTPDPESQGHLVRNCKTRYEIQASMVSEVLSKAI